MQHCLSDIYLRISRQHSGLHKGVHYEKITAPGELDSGLITILYRTALMIFYVIFAGKERQCIDICNYNFYIINFT